jgi:hypothetical protein
MSGCPAGLLSLPSKDLPMEDRGMETAGGLSGLWRSIHCRLPSCNSASDIIGSAAMTKDPMLASKDKQVMTLKNDCPAFRIAAPSLHLKLLSSIVSDR